MKKNKIVCKNCSNYVFYQKELKLSTGLKIMDTHYCRVELIKNKNMYFSEEDFFETEIPSECTMEFETLMFDENEKLGIKL